jgi:hypothetical protein
VSQSATIFLGVIAVSTLLMAAVQIGVILVLVRLSRRVDQLAGQVEREIAPMAERLRAIADNLQAASSLAAVQVERVDRMLASVSRRTEETIGVVQHAIVAPVRELMAVIAAIRGVTAAVRGFRSGGAARSSSRFDEEDPLFIG